MLFFYCSECCEIFIPVYILVKVLTTVYTPQVLKAQLCGQFDQSNTKTQCMMVVISGQRPLADHLADHVCSKPELCLLSPCSWTLPHSLWIFIHQFHNKYSYKWLVHQFRHEYSSTIFINEYLSAVKCTHSIHSFVMNYVATWKVVFLCICDEIQCQHTWVRCIFFVH